MASAASPAPGAQPEQTIQMGRRLYRGIAFALLVGIAGALLSAVPALFVQSVFVVENERCLEAQQSPATQQQGQDCAEMLADAPVWLPLAVVAGGAALGVVGGFAYGFIAPKPAARRGAELEGRWLPF